jgi:2-iminobutanoate/2-iminopropanoate deaminase
MPAQSIPTPSAPPVAGPYSPAVRAGDLVFLAGQLGLDPTTHDLVTGGAGPQTAQALKNIALVLADCGGTLDDVAKTTIFVTNLDHFGVINSEYAEFFGGRCPARSTVQVAALPLGGLVEIEVIAHIPA